VSGYAFLVAIPYLKTAFQICSISTGLPSINDNKSYVWQGVFGWWIAYLATNRQQKAEGCTLNPGYFHGGRKIILTLSI